MTKKKNQHYVPQFYLKNFSINNNRKSIGVFHQEKELFIRSSSIKHQGSKDFYYGKDGLIEEGLSQIESLLAPKLKDIIKTGVLPKKESDEHIALLIHIILTDLRNPTRINQTKNSFVKLKNEIKKFSPEANNVEFLDNIPHEFSVQLSINNYRKILPLCFDLEYKILKSSHDSFFITSDFPVIRYNQLFENLRPQDSNQGYGNLGLQIFFPISPNYCIIFYDSMIYKVGAKKEKTILLDKDDIDQINLLHFLNSKSNIYFNEAISESYLKSLLLLSKKFDLANQTTLSSYEVLKNDQVQENEQIIFLGSTDLRSKLKLKKVKFLRKVSNLNVGNKVVVLRPKAESVLNYYRQQRL